MPRYTAISKTKRGQREALRQQERRRKTMTWGGVGLLALVLVGGLIWLFTRPSNAPADPAGIPVTSGLLRDHIQEGSDPGTYSTNPPAGGKHYPTTYNPGFYTEEDAAKMPQLPAGYLVHNLEHGYIIYWYNCQADPAIDCAQMQDAIRQVIRENNSFKVIGFPWPSQKEPLVMTSWGRILRQKTVDLSVMRAFYRSNVNKGPEATPN